MLATLFPGFALRQGQGKYSHRIGGAGGTFPDCPNCNKPLMLHLSLDCRDPLLKLSYGGCTLPLLYCMRCSLCWYDFAYKFTPPDRIEILACHRGERQWEDWYAEMGDVIPERNVELLPLSDTAQSVVDWLNEFDKSDGRDQEIYNKAFGRKASRNIDAANQIGGRPFLFHRSTESRCPVCCEEQLGYLASLFNEPTLGIMLMPASADAQILFLICEGCDAIIVRHFTT